MAYSKGVNENNGANSLLTKVGEALRKHEMVKHKGTSNSKRSL